MDAKAQREAQLFIASARADIEEDGRQLQATKDDIARALKAAEDLTVEAHRLHERTKELEMDEEVLKKSQEAAVQEKLGAEKRLMEVGGYERVVRVMQKELRDAKSELQRTKGTYFHTTWFYPCAFDLTLDMNAPR
jgi:predicted  nucleic acid-binding Zn-ribbon protein